VGAVAVAPSLSLSPPRISLTLSRYSQYASTTPSATWHRSTDAAPSRRTPWLTSVKCLNSSRLAAHASSCSYPNPVTSRARSTRDTRETAIGAPFSVAPPLRAAAYVFVAHAPGPPTNSMTTPATGTARRRTATETAKEG
jgi:hypothetical protein